VRDVGAVSRKELGKVRGAGRLGKRDLHIGLPQGSAFDPQFHESLPLGLVASLD
jgi:hypothetical protein